MVLVVYRQMPARAVAVSKRKRHHVAGGPRVEVAFQQLRRVVLDLLHRRSARGAGFDELESGVLHAPSAGLAAGDDGFVAPQLGDGAEDGAPVAVEEPDDAPHGELLPREVSVDQSFGHRGRRRTASPLVPPYALSVHRDYGGPVLDVEVAHLGLVVEVMVRHFRVVGRRRDHDEPE